jgi:hypothetical protein
MRHIKKLLLTIIVLAILGGVFVFAVRYIHKRAIVDSFVVLRADGSPVPHSDLAWVQTLADNLAEEFGDDMLQRFITDGGRSCGYFLVHQGITAGAMSRRGHVDGPTLFPFRSRNANYYVDREGEVSFQLRGDVLFAQPFFEGLAAIGARPEQSSEGRKHIQYHFIGTSGDVAIPGPFNSAGPFSEGLAVVGIEIESGETRYGTIDRTGAWVIEAQFSKLHAFSDGLAGAQLAEVDGEPGTTGFIDRTGEFVVTLNPSYSVQSSHRDGLALVTRKDPSETFYVDRKGKRALTPGKGNCQPFYNGIVAFREESGWGYIDTMGREVIPPIYVHAMAADSGMVALTTYDPLEKSFWE